MYTLAEKVETIVFSFLRGGAEDFASGTFGTIQRTEAGYLVTAEGQRFKVRSSGAGWQVRRDGSSMVGCDPSLCDAAHLAISEG